MWPRMLPAVICIVLCLIQCRAAPTSPSPSSKDDAVSRATSCQSECLDKYGYVLLKDNVKQPVARGITLKQKNNGKCKCHLSNMLVRNPEVKSNKILNEQALQKIFTNLPAPATKAYLSLAGQKHAPKQTKDQSDNVLSVTKIPSTSKQNVDSTI